MKRASDYAFSTTPCWTIATIYQRVGGRDSAKVRWSSKKGQGQVLPSTAHARQNTSERLAADPQELHARL